MGEADASPLEKAEAVVKRILERFGAAVDKKLHADGDRDVLSPNQVGEFISKLEEAVQGSLRPDSNSVRRIAPNNFKLLFTYEQSAHLSEAYKQELATALTAEVYEFIHNRRYTTLGEVRVEIAADLFTKATTVKCGFDSDAESPHIQKSAPGAGTANLQRVRSIELEGPHGRQFNLKLKPGDPPAYIGRGAGIAVRLDDPGISRLHSSIALRAGDEVVLSDLGSANGTYVNGRIVSSGEVVRLRSGDVIAVAGSQLTVKAIV